MKEIKSKRPLKRISILHWLDYCRLIANCCSNSSRVFKNWKQSACMIFVHQTNDLLEKVQMDKKFVEKDQVISNSHITFYKLTQVCVICDSCRLSWIECLAISSIFYRASWSLSLSMCLLTGWIFKDDKKLLTCSPYIPASTNHCFKKLIEVTLIWYMCIKKWSDN